MAQLRDRRATLESELAQLAQDAGWPPVGYYTAYHLVAGMLLGALLHVVLTRWLGGKSFRRRFLLLSALVLGLWVVNYYLLLSWLQPLLFGGAWIVQSIPWWVAAATHLVFGWSLLLMEPWGRFERR